MILIGRLGKFCAAVGYVAAGVSGALGRNAEVVRRDRDDPRLELLGGVEGGAA